MTARMTVLLLAALLGAACSVAPDSPIRTKAIVTRAGGLAGLHEALEISPSGKVSGAWMGTSYDSELNANQIKRIGSALDASGLFKGTEPRTSAGSDLIWIRARRRYYEPSRSVITRWSPRPNRRRFYP